VETDFSLRWFHDPESNIAVGIAAGLFDRMPDRHASARPDNGEAISGDTPGGKVIANRFRAFTADLHIYFL
jgi:hypothetical protein